MHAEPKTISIFPGTNYGHVSFKSASDAEKVMEQMDGQNVKNLKFYGKERVVVFLYTKFEGKDLRKNASIDVPNAEFAKTNSLPGLYVFDEFITEQEEQDMVKLID